MRISIALCTYNGAKYLAHQLESFVRQERKPDEVIVRDDRSTDETPLVLERFAETAPFAVRWAMNDRHLGSTANFDRTIQECTGELIALCDQDDVWRPEKLQRMEAVFHGDPSIVLAASNAELIDAEGEGTGRDLWSAVGFSEGVREKFRQDAAQVLLRQTCLPGATMVFRRELLPWVCPIPQTWVHDAWIAQIAALVGGIRLVSDDLIAYRVHPLQQTGIGPSGLAEKPVPWAAWLDHSAWNTSRRTDFAKVADDIDSLICKAREIQSRWKDGSKDPCMLSMLDEKRRHFRQRSCMRSANIFRRLPLILMELLSLRYKRCGFGTFGLLSALSDVVFTLDATANDDNAEDKNG